LSVRGEGAPVAVGDMVIIGYANGKLMAINSADGAHIITTDKNDVITENWRSIKISQAVYF
jgi:outer membrane protein assembly factor BamB